MAIVVMFPLLLERFTSVATGVRNLMGEYMCGTAATGAIPTINLTCIVKIIFMQMQCNLHYS